MSRTIERRVRAIETKRQQTELSSMPDEELQRRILDGHAYLLQFYAPDELRAAMLAMGVSAAVVDTMPEVEGMTHAAH